MYHYQVDRRVAYGGVIQPQKTVRLIKLAKNMADILINKQGLAGALEVLEFRAQNIESEDRGIFAGLNAEEKRYLIGQAMSYVRELHAQHFPSQLDDDDYEAIYDTAQNAFNLIRETMKNEDTTLAQKWKKSEWLKNYLNSPEGRQAMADAYYEGKNADQQTKEYWAKVMQGESINLHRDYEQRYKDEVKSMVDKARQRQALEHSK